MWNTRERFMYEELFQPTDDEKYYWRFEIKVEQKATYYYELDEEHFVHHY